MRVLAIGLEAVISSCSSIAACCPAIGDFAICTYGRTWTHALRRGMLGVYRCRAANNAEHSPNLTLPLIDPPRFRIND